MPGRGAVPEKKEETFRSFIAFFPGPDTESEIFSVSERIRETRPESARFTPKGKLHLTLAFLGNVTSEQLRKAAEIIERPEFRWPSELSFGRLGRFRKTEILWLGTDSPQLRGGAELLRKRLSEAGIPFDAAPFRAHVTLARRWNGPVPEQDFRPVLWRTGTPVLTLSVRMPDQSFRYISYSKQHRPLPGKK